ncbi:tannase/feruloyl esterase family alpha/beta hydrolase [Cupriavidus sp. AU9028]|uniref:tannase/feruloyl esterase family alpha/beta hydrolase n=1 Tax=Cupriavidus sp. AU9028 TaxID=2871157 RepID=UPI001C948ABE|nr:tannase/feruloyl esterase family alpha/beta hydrolase [Cupriavidus sp. AU9028]MBY4897190.1 tannase/feruloyl esterase family alpha/beta hydrolase [Cupriavidus sp. AU9028]
MTGTLLAGVVLTIGACGSDDDDDHHQPPPPAAQTPKTCQEMAGLTVPASAIGLPTSGAAVTEATVVAASGTGAQAVGEYCRVLGAIRPVDPNAPEIRFQLNLPVNWNNKIMMFGGGGYNGTIPSPAQNVPAGPANQPTPLGRGYATFASDSGHQAGALGSRDGSFGVNDEALRNFAGDALKKTRDTALHLIKARYAVDGPRKAYFAGGSTGGREALAVVQRWPLDWDGAIVLYPAWNAASLDLQIGRITRALALPGAYPNAAERRALFDASLQACDTLDGAQDGLVSNMARCNATFDPATATLNGAPLRCADGLDTGDNCLSDAQILALKVYSTPIHFNYPLGSGETHYPGFNLWGSDLGMANPSPVQATVISLALNLDQPTYPMPATAPYLSVFWDQWVRFFVTRDPNFNSLTLDPENPGAWQARISELTALQDVNKTDLSAFAAKGGKVLMAHGTGDVLVSSRASVLYYERVRDTMGKDLVGKLMRYYEIPGYGHAASTVFNAAWDSLTTLEQWVENGTEPSAQVVADTVGVPGRTRPLCEYPSWPKYNGGDINAAASYSCVKE